MNLSVPLGVPFAPGMLLPHLEKENHRGTDADIYVLLRREAFPPNAPKRSSGEAVMNEGLVPHEGLEPPTHCLRSNCSTT